MKRRIKLLKKTNLKRETCDGLNVERPLPSRTRKEGFYEKAEIFSGVALGSGGLSHFAAAATATRIAASTIIAWLAASVMAARTSERIS
jgi:hypothetical protein